MSSETIWKQSSQVTAISTTANVASNNFNGASEVTSLSSTQTGKYPLADAAIFASFSTSVSSTSNVLVVYRRDLNIDGANDAPIPQSAAPAYSALQVGAITVPPYTATSSGYFSLPDIPLPAGADCEFYIQNLTNATITGFTLKLTPKTYTPAA